jgi:tetratricopeptide (TPR) repeat protein
MIERLLEADRLLALGLTDQAERIYWQAVETDPRNAIAVVGLARVASERGDDRTALEFARKAHEIDPENPAAMRLAARLEEIVATREAAAGAAGATDAVTGAAAAGGTDAAAAADAAGARPSPAPAPGTARPSHDRRHTTRRGLLGRLLGGR